MDDALCPRSVHSTPSPILSRAQPTEETEPQNRLQSDADPQLRGDELGSGRSGRRITLILRADYLRPGQIHQLQCGHVWFHDS